MDNINFSLSGFQEEDGTINMTLAANETFNLTLRYSDPILAHNIISNLAYILSDMLDEALEESFTYNIDEELKKLLEEGK